MTDASRQEAALDSVGADDWFELLGEEIAEFEQLCQVVGRRFVAFSFVAGVRISSIAYDPQAPHMSQVEFSTGDEQDTQQVTLADFREQLGTAVLAHEASSVPLPPSPTPEDLRVHIGRRYVLLAPIFGIRLNKLEYGGGEPDMLQVQLGAAAERLSIDAFRDILDNAVRSEVARSRPSSPFSIDFKKVPQAQAANTRGDYDETIALLGSWPGPLSMFLRTPQGQALGENERNKLVAALGALGRAYLGKGQPDWAEDVLRLGIQFGQEVESSCELFGLLGNSRIAAQRYGEAIGLFRRALGLGASAEEFLPPLARCYLERGRNVAAMVCLQDAEKAGAEPHLLTPLRVQIQAALGEGYDRYAELWAE